MDKKSDKKLIVNYFTVRGKVEVISRHILLKHPNWSNQKLIAYIRDETKKMYLQKGITLDDELLLWAMKDIAKKTNYCFLTENTEFGKLHTIINIDEHISSSSFFSTQYTTKIW